MKALLAVFCFLHCIICAFAQVKPTASFRHFTTAEGMASTQVQGLYEDSRGYIWVITDRGASVYDGYHFKTYSAKHGMPTNSLLLVNEDNKGRMWFMCNNGTYCYLEDDSIKTYKGSAKIAALLKDRLPGPFFFDDKDTMWVTTFSGIQLFKCYGDSVMEYIPDAKGEHPTYYLRQVGDKLVNLQMGTISGENKLVVADKLSYLLTVAGDCKLACSVQVDENKWVLSGPGGFVVFDEAGNINAHFNSSPYVFSSMDHDRSGHLWLTNSNGAYRLDNYNEHPDSAKVFFEGHFITALLQDRNGNYWLGDRDNGVYFVPSLEMKLYQSEAEGKPRKIVSIKAYDNEIFYSDASGKVFVIHDGISYAHTENDLPSGVGLDFVRLSSGDFIVGNKPHRYGSKKDEIVSLQIESVIRRSLTLSDGSHAFALADGIAFADPMGTWQAVDKSIFKERSNCLFEAENKTLWIGTNNGLFRYEHGVFIACDSLNKLMPRIVDITACYDETAAFWNDYLVLATRNMGIILYKNANDFVVVNEQDGLLSDITDCVELDEWGELWIGQAGGLQRMKIKDLAQKQFEFSRVNYDKGLPSNEVNDLMCLAGVMYVATNNGLALIDVNGSSLGASTSPVKIESLHSGATEIPLGDSLVLQHFQNDLQFHFAALNYRTASKTVYRYRLIGLHNAWQQTTNRGAEYWKLNAGTYTFEVSAMNEDGLWNEPSKISFTIRQHFTKTLWFRALLVVLVLGAVGLSFYLFYRNKRRKLESKAKMLELRQQALNANMNPHFIFNSLSSIQHFINTSRTREANDYLADFSKLIRMNLETNRHNMVSLEDELERLELYLKLEQLRFGERLTYSIRVSSVLNVYDLQIPPMLLQPYVENALLHGILPGEGDGIIDIEVRGDATKYNITITDNGIGINQSNAQKQHKHESLALRMNEERMAILRNQTGEEFSIEVKDRSEGAPDTTGTMVRVDLPVNV
ncbi:MAG: histidine kinase [Flavobacteriales bacterium]